MWHILIFTHGPLRDEHGSSDGLFILLLLLYLHTSSISETHIWTHQTSHESISLELPGQEPQTQESEAGMLPLGHNR